MRTGLIKAFSLVEMARIEQKSQNTILNNPDRYIPIRIDSAISRRGKKGYTIKYIRASDINLLQSRE